MASSTATETTSAVRRGLWWGLLAPVSLAVWGLTNDALKPNTPPSSSVRPLVHVHHNYQPGTTIELIKSSGIKWVIGGNRVKSPDWLGQGGQCQRSADNQQLVCLYQTLDGVQAYVETTEGRGEIIPLEVPSIDALERNWR